MKKNNLLAAILMVIGIAALGFLTSWWFSAIWVVFIVALFKLSAKQGMLFGGLSFSIVWTGVAIYMISIDATAILAKTGALLGGLSPAIMVVIVLIISSITGILSGWLGSRIGGHLELRKAAKANKV